MVRELHAGAKAVHPRHREVRKKPSDQPRRFHLRIGQRVSFEVWCTYQQHYRWNRCAGWNCSMPARYSGTIVQKRGEWYLVETDAPYRGLRWVLPESMFLRDHNGRTWTTPVTQGFINDGPQRMVRC